MLHGIAASLLVWTALPVAAQGSPTAPADVRPVQGPEHQEVQRLLRDGQPAQALKAVDAYLARQPTEPNMRFRRGVALTMLDRRAEAVAVFEKLTEEFPQMPAPYNNLAVLYGASGDYEKARTALERAIRTNPSYATAYENLGDVYAQLASQAYSKALQIDRSGMPNVPPKLALLRDLIGTGSAAEVAALTRPAPPPSATVAMATSPAAPPAAPPAASPTVAPNVPPAPAVTRPAPVPAPVPSPVPSPVPAPAPSPAPVAAAPSPAPTSTPPAGEPAAARPDAELAEIQAAVNKWAEAWSRRDMRAYFNAYTPDFAGQAGTRAAWERDRRDRIAPRKSIRVEVADLRVSVTGDSGEARFTQTYASDTLNIRSRKTLGLVRVNGKWLIRREAVGG